MGVGPSLPPAIFRSPLMGVPGKLPFGVLGPILYGRPKVPNSFPQAAGQEGNPPGSEKNDQEEEHQEDFQQTEVHRKARPCGIWKPKTTKSPEEAAEEKLEGITPLGTPRPHLSNSFAMVWSCMLEVPS